MTIKLLTLAARDAKPMLSRLQEIAGRDLEIAFHLGDSEADIKASSLSKMTAQRGRKGHLMDGKRFTAARHAAMTDPDYLSQMEAFIDHLQRRAAPYRYTSHNLQNLQDYIDYYHILFDAAADQIIQSGATHMLFFNIPHMGYDTVFYQAGKALGLKPVLFNQSLFPGRFFSMPAPEAYGRFTPHFDPDVIHPIQKGEPMDLFYMKNIKQEQGAPGRINAKGLWNLFSYIVTKDPAKALNPVWLVRTLKRMQAIYGAFPDWRDPFSRFFHVNNLAYFEHLAEYEQTPIELDKKFVYFPLQLQPEMTTSALGGKYRDQALAIEDLASILPPDVLIYVKENPKQLGFARGPMFFHRLNRIPNVRIMPSYANTHALSDAALCIASITGTAGWEAICKGKPAICFGDTWYQSLPGVTRFDESTRWEDVVSTEIDHDRLQQAMGSLMARSHEGVLYRHYKKIAPDFDLDRNADAVARTIYGIMKGDTPYSFTLPEAQP